MATALVQEVTPSWASTMRAITGTMEVAGEGDNPKILAMADAIAEQFPEMRTYCDLYTHDSIPWCGLAAAHCMAVNGYRPPFAAGDTGKFLWAKSWSTWGNELDEPRLGCVVVLTREGGGHVGFLEEVQDTTLRIRGGNQSDAVNVQSFPKSSVIAYVWPDTAPVPQPPPGWESMPLIKMGDTGAAVVEAQRLLGGVEVDGIFGEETDSATREFQAKHGLLVDGEIGPETWKALYNEGGITVEDDLPLSVISEITTAAEASSIAKYNWPNRGKAPLGYTKGMAVTYGYVYQKLTLGDSVAQSMAKGASQDASKDALAWYAPEFAALGMDNSQDGKDTLRHLFVLLIGLGMRESSGKYCEGRDQSASNVTADTAEAGLFQTSWNAHRASNQMLRIYETYSKEPGETGFIEVFRENASCSSASWQNYGSGTGAAYQALSKSCPAFHVEFTALGLRVLRQHWGPINRKEAELRREADELLKEVERIVDAGPPIPPEPLPEPVSAEQVADEICRAIRPAVVEVLQGYRIFGKAVEPKSVGTVVSEVIQGMLRPFTPKGG